MPKPHKHAGVLRAIADGVPLTEFELRWAGGIGWGPAEDQLYALVNDPSAEVRRKPRTHTVNGFTVPAPLVSLDFDEEYFLVRIQDGKPGAEQRHNNTEPLGAEHCLRGIVHPTKEAALANAKAMLKIDPDMG